MGLGALPLAITILVAPAQLKMEEGVAPATVTVTVTAPGSAATHLRLWCSTGALSRARELGNGRFAASYAPPAAGKPTFAVLAAWDEQSGEAAAATVVLVGRTEIPVETEPGAQVVAVVHGRRSVARANAAGHARVPAWVWPGDRNATVTAIDAAGNATTQELPLELPPPDGVFLLAPAEVAAGQPVPVWAFATGTTTPELAVTGGGLLSSIALRPGVASARLQARAEVTLTALGAGDRAEQRIRMATTTPPPARLIALGPQPSQRTPPPAPSTPSPPKGGPPSGGASLRAAREPPLSPWELGAALSGRYSGTFVGGGGVLAARRRLGRFAVGLDLDGRYANGALAGDDLRAGGLGLRLAAEMRFAVSPRATLFLAAGAGGHWASVRRAPPAGAAVTTNDGGPSLSGGGGLLVRAGPGVVELGVGYAWTPLVRHALANLDGVTLSVGYRAARWRRRRRRRRRGGGRRPRGRRRRARGT